MRRHMFLFSQKSPHMTHWALHLRLLLTLLLTLLIASVAVLAIPLSAHAIVAEQAQPVAEHVVAPKITVAEIIARNADARGGIEAWRAIAGLSEVGRMETVPLNVISGAHKQRADAHAKKIDAVARDRAIPFTLHMQRPHKMYLEIQYNGATAIQVFDGVQGWTVTPTPNGAVAVKYAPQTARATAAQQDLDGPLIDSAAKGTKVALEGVELVDGRNTYRLALTLRDGLERHLWIDTENFLDIKIDGTRIVAGTPWPVETYFSGYKMVHGLQIPHILDTAIGGARTTERIVIDHITLNPVLSETLFAPPAMSTGQ